MFLLICKLYICIQNVFGHIFYRSRLHSYWQFWQFKVKTLAYMLILAAGGSSPYLSSVPPLAKKTSQLGREGGGRRRHIFVSLSQNLRLIYFKYLFQFEQYNQIIKGVMIFSVFISFLHV